MRSGVGQDMSHPLRLLFVILALLFLTSLKAAYSAPPLERGTAILDPAALRDLDRGRFGLAQMLGAPSDAPLTNNALFALPSMAPIRQSLDSEFERYVAHHTAERPNETIGVGDRFDAQLFDRDQLYSGATRFVLSGIVNRMDRAYVAPDSCGEVRLIYRLAQIDAPPVGDHGASARLPMTLNLVLKAKADKATDKGVPLTCADIARRWLEAGDGPLA